MSFILNAVLWLILMYIIAPYDIKTDLNALLSLLLYSNIDVCKMYNAEAKLPTTA